MSTLLLSQTLLLPRCPHCRVAHPTLEGKGDLETVDHNAENRRHWRMYVCTTCGGLVTAWATKANLQAGKAAAECVYPTPAAVDADLPEWPRSLLQQAHDSMHAPSGAIMLAAAAVDAMLQLKSFTDGTLNTRIEAAAKAHVITPGMAAWAHDIRLDSNAQRHADPTATAPTEADAKRVVEFADALAEFMFCLPARVTRGIGKKS